MYGIVGRVSVLISLGFGREGVLSDFEVALGICLRESVQGESICPTPKKLEVSGRGEVFLRSEIGHGSHSVVYSTDHEDLVVKVSMGVSFCREIATLLFLDGSIQQVPRIHPISSGVSTACMWKTLVMDRMGDADWASASHSWCRFGHLLKVVKNVHVAGIVHGDLHTKNIRIERNDPTYVGLIDWDRAEPLGNKNRNLDIYRLVHSIAFNGDGTKEWFVEFRNDFMLHPPLYDKWIAYFTNNYCKG